MRLDRQLAYSIAVIAGSAFIGSASNAQAPAQTPSAPSNQDSSTNNPDMPLSKKLDKNDGVLKPPKGIDPEIHQPAPANTGDKMPVIVPPGEPGGDQSIQPK